MKKLTVVFPIQVNKDGVVKILMGKKAPGTKLAGFRNGYGGKCEEGETPLDCAIREVKEEIGLDLELNKLTEVCLVRESDKVVHFYLYEFDSGIELPDGRDFVDNTWFILENIESYVNEMLAEDRRLMDEIVDVVKTRKYKGPGFKPRTLDFSDSKELQEQTRAIYK